MKNQILLLFLLAAFIFSACKKDEAPPNPCATVVCLNGGACDAGTCACINGFTGTQCEIAPKTWADVDYVSIKYFRSNFFFLPEGTDLTLSVETTGQSTPLTFYNTADDDLHRIFDPPVNLAKENFFYLLVVQTNCPPPDPCPATVSSIEAPDTYGPALENEWAINMGDGSVVYIGIEYHY